MEQEAGTGGGTEKQSSSEISKQLLRASLYGDLNKVKSLVEVEHVDPRSCRNEQYHSTPLHLASGHGHLDIVRYLVEERNCDVECRNKYENTPLVLAADKGRLDVVQYLISERGCDPMCRGWYGKTPLHRACEKGRLNVVKYLLKDVKVDSSCRDVDDLTPLHLAALNGELSVVKLLVEDYLCDPGVRDNNGETPADMAMRKGHTNITSYLSSIEKTVSNTHSPSHGRGPVEAESERDKSSTEKSSSATGGHTGSRLHIIAICIAVVGIQLVIMEIFGPPAISVDVTSTTIQTSTTMQTVALAGNDPNFKWINKEPDIKLLTLIKYPNSEGKEDRFYLTRTIQNNCKNLGTFLGIDKETLTSYSEKSKPKSEVCEDILYEWMKRSEGDYDVTWAGLLKAMDDAGLGGVANQLFRTLNMHFK